MARTKKKSVARQVKIGKRVYGNEGKKKFGDWEPKICPNQKVLKQGKKP